MTGLIMMLATGCSEPAARASDPFSPPTSDTGVDGGEPEPSRTRPMASNMSDQIADPFARADRSFSRFALNSAFDPVEAGLRLAQPQCMEKDFSCEWRDSDGVGHIFGGKRLAIKLMLVAGREGEAIPALSIGKARGRRDLLRRIADFLPELSVTCKSPDEAGEAPDLSSCSASFENGGWIELLFDDDDQLVLARIDAFQIS